MVDNDLKFFTNEPDRNLYERFNNILNSSTQYFDILVGYFRTSGFYRLYPAMEKVDKIRVLVGLNVDHKTIEIINQSEKELAFETLSHKEAKDAFSKVVEKEFANSEDSLEVEKSVRIFIDWLKTSKMEMRMYTASPIHAKVYIMRKNMELVPDTYGSVITGSSNFSDAGLKNNLEFNVELKDKSDVVFALEKFERLWEKSVAITDAYVETIEDKTWLKSDITPYEIYLKTIYEFFEEEINEDSNTSLADLLPEGYMQLQYQQDAVTQAQKILKAYGGVFISDVVGLGKTYICAMLAKSLKNKRKLIICPPVLIDYWKRVLEEFDVAARVESLGKLDRLLEDEKELAKYDYVFIDEAHRFRNQDTESFNLLHQICYNKKVILISATPINNYSSDIENQIYLFQSKHNSTIIPNIKNIEGFFAKLNGSLKRLEKGTPEYSAQSRRNSEIIRDSLLRHIMIRRTRKEIMTFYKNDLAKQGLTFPELGTPEKVIYAFDDKTEEVFKETMNTIKSLDYSRYTPLLYLNENKKYSQMMVAQSNMGGFMKSILVKRLESSFYAFKQTLSRFIDSYKKFIEMCENGDVYISKKVNVYDLLDSGDDKKLLEFIDEERIKHFKFSEFNQKFMPCLNRDLSLLEELKAHWEEITDDPKLEQFKKELQSNKILKGAKIIVFTESKETAEYLGVNLKAMYQDKVVVFSGASNRQLKKEIEYSFNPLYQSEGKDKYQILITTDVLAEGINLHRSNVVINYDLPWNPTRIMQRVGRINRVGTEFDKIYVFNFFPTSQSNQHLSLKDRIIEKIQAFHDTLGEDFKYLSEDEDVSSHNLYDRLTGNPEDEDSDGTNPELAYLALIRDIRENDIELFEKIKRLPLKGKAGKKSQLINGDATITFMRKGALKVFVKTEQRNTEQLSFINAIKYIQADKDEKAIGVGAGYYEDLNKNKQLFDEILNEEKMATMEKTVITGNDGKIIKIIKSLLNCKKFTVPQEKQLKHLITLWEEGIIPQPITKSIIKELKDIQDELQAFYIIHEKIPERYFADKNMNQVNSNGKQQVILSSFMRNGVVN